MGNRFQYDNLVCQIDNHDNLMSAAIIETAGIRDRYTTTRKAYRQDAMESTNKFVIFLTTLLYLLVTQSFPHLPIQ